MCRGTFCEKAPGYHDCTGDGFSLYLEEQLSFVRDLSVDWASQIICKPVPVRRTRAVVIYSNNGHSEYDLQ